MIAPGANQRSTQCGFTVLELMVAIVILSVIITYALPRFQKALEQHAQSDNMFQQGEFRNVMDKAMNVLNETARELKNKSLAEQNDKISKDYEAFIKQPANEKAWDICVLVSPKKNLVLLL